MVNVGVKVKVGVGVQAGLLAATVCAGAIKAVLGVWLEQEIPNKRTFKPIPVNKKTINIRFMPEPFLLEPYGCTNREVQTTAVFRTIGSI